MEATAEKMEAQLKLWSLKIDALAAKTQKAGVRVGFDALIYIDELKALRAIAQARFDEFRAAGGADRKRLEAEMRSAWNELDAAFKNAKPKPVRREPAGKDEGVFPSADSRKRGYAP